MIVYVKARAKTATRFHFVTPKGALNALRIHAARFEGAEAARRFITENEPGNPNIVWKIVDGEGREVAP